MVAGIICEYNPMHNAHVYHIEKTRAAGADFIVCVMSGNFVQRGECASLDKWSRAKIAIENGADLVLELPTPWACGSAQTFARGSLQILDAFGIDSLSFGSEVDSEEQLINCAKFLEDEEIKLQVRRFMKSGLSYPMALSKAFQIGEGEKYSKIISNPNSTLAIEYIKQINLQNDKIKILAIKREAVDHDSETSKDNFASASFLRKLDLKEDIEKFIPKSAYNLIKEQIEKGYAPCKMKNGERALIAKLRSLSKQQLTSFISDETGLVSRVYESAKTSCSIEEFYDNIKIKNYTHSRIRRETLNAFLQIDKTITQNSVPYIKVLAANQSGLKLIASKKENMKLPIVTKHSEMMKLDESAQKVYDIECKASDMFALFSEAIRPSSLEQTNSIIIKK